MKKFKSILFYIFVGLGLVAAVWGYFYLKQTKKPSLNASNVLPINASYIVSSSNFHELTNKITNKNLIWNELINVTEFKKINNYLQYFDSLSTEVEELNGFLEGREIFLATYSKLNSVDALIVFNLQDMTKEKEYKEAIKTVFKIEEGKDNEFEIWEGNRRFTIKISQGVVAIAENKELALSCFDASIQKQYKETAFQSLVKNVDEENIFNLYINHTLPPIKTSSINKNENVLTGHSVCNIDISPDAITANGFNACDSLSLLNYLVNQPAQPCDFLHMLPFNAISYKAIAISNFDLLKQKNKINKGDCNFWKAANDSALYNVEQQVSENINTKAVEFEFLNSGSINKSLIIEIKDSAFMKESLKFLSDSIFSNQGNNIYKFKSCSRDFSKVMFGNLFSVKPYCSFVYGNYLIISESVEAALFQLSSLLNNSSITQNQIFMSYATDNLLVNFNYQWYCAINKKPIIIKNLLPFISDSALKSFNKISDASLNITNYKSMYQFRAQIKYQSFSQNKEVPGLWTLEADTQIITKPFVFRNHKSNENELVFQDAKNNVYLVNATGNVLWKKNINELAVSEFYTVDAFKNNKFQILFNTKNYIHLIDRNGNYVPGYPVKLSSSATNEMTLLDYENTKDYRILIACADHKIYNYNINGTKNDKFTPIPVDEDVSAKINYVKVGASDYLVAHDYEGKIYVYSRRGEGRIDLSNKLLTHTKAVYIEPTNSIQNTKLFYLDDKNSLLENVTLVDKKDAIKLGADFDNANYYFELIDDDKKTDIVVLDKTKLICYDFTGNELYKYETGDDVYINAKYYYDADGAFFILNHINNEVHVLQVSSKKITKRFKGNGQPLLYDLFKDGKKYIIVSENNLLKCVLLK